jgi:hypothetical protein
MRAPLKREHNYQRILDNPIMSCRGWRRAEGCIEFYNDL